MAEKKVSFLKNNATAPFVYFDGAPALGAASGLIEIELCARYMVPQSDNSVTAEAVCVAHLRCTPAAAMNLREAIDRALGMAESAENSNKAKKYVLSAEPGDYSRSQ